MDGGEGGDESEERGDEETSSGSRPAPAVSSPLDISSEIRSNE